ncbi:MAG: S8 family serine peptidase [Desulfatibacillaceae bacterium]
MPIGIETRTAKTAAAAGLLVIVALFSGTARAASSDCVGQPGAYTLSAGSEGVSLTATCADLVEVLAAFSEKTGVRVQPAPEVRGRVTASFAGLSPDRALARLARNMGVVWLRDPDTGAVRMERAFVAPEAARTPESETGPSGAADTPGPAGAGGKATAPAAVAAEKPGSGAPDKYRCRVVPGEVLIRLSTEAPEDAAASLARSLGGAVSSRVPELGYAVLSVPGDLDPRRAAVRLAGNPAVEVAEPNYLIPLLDVPDDPEFNRQWPLDNDGGSGGVPGADISAPAAWDLEKGAPDTVIAIIDTGVDHTHPDLAANLWRNPGEVPDNGVDDDDNGFVDDVIGWDFVDADEGAADEDFQEPDNDPMDGHGHGTHVAGIAAAATGNGTGIAGVAWNCGFMAVRAGYRTAGGGGVLESLDAARAVVYAVDNGADVVNLSWGDYEKSNLIEDALLYAVNGGVVVCAAAGNDGSRGLVYPAGSRNMGVIAVGATDRSDNKSSFSNFGEWVDVSAPGTSVYSTHLSHGYLTLSGTSMATPHVAGIAALAVRRFPELKAVEIKARILRTADTLAGLAGMNLVSGRANAHAALAEVPDTPYIFALDPPAAHEGDTVAVFGDRFGNTPGAVFFFPGISAQIQEWSSTTIRCVVPEGAQGGELTVTTADAGSAGHTVAVLETFYNRSTTPSAWSLSGTRMGLVGDDLARSQALPFTFTFFGAHYDTVNVCTNGYLDFTSQAASYKNSTQALKNRTMIAVFWDDLVTDGDALPGEDVYVNARADRVVFTWMAERFETRDPVRASAVLHADGRIGLHYGPGNTNASPTVGISGGDGVSYHLAPHDDAADLGNADSVYYTPVANSFTLSLLRGWNLVSVPFAPGTPGVPEVFGEAAAKVLAIWGYGEGGWRTWVPGVVDDIGALRYGEGYWVHASGAADIELYGTPGPLAVRLHEGWNLVGFPVTGPTPVDQALDAMQGGVDSVWGMDGSDWIVYEPASSNPGGLTRVAPGRGYWIYSSSQNP